MRIQIPERARYEKEQRDKRRKEQAMFGSAPEDERGVKNKQYDVIMIKHEFDLDYLLLSLEEDPTCVNVDEYFRDRFELLVSKSLEESTSMMEVNQTNRHAFGKLKLKILSLENLACSNTFFIRVTSEPFVVTSRKIIGFDSDRLN